MKVPRVKSLIRSLCLASFCTVVAAAGGDSEWRSFQNADETRSFTGRVVAYDAKRDRVTMEIKGSAKQVFFNLALLKPEDQTFVKEQARYLAALSSFRVDFDKFMDRTGESTKGDTTTTSYDGGCRVTVKNITTANVDGVEIEYILVWRKDSFEGYGAEQLITGSEQLSSVAAGSAEKLSLGSIPMQAVVEKGRVTGVSTTGGSCRTCPPAGTTITSSPTKRSRDQIVGCIVRIRLAGKVVKTVASNAGVFKRYKEHFSAVGAP